MRMKALLALAAFVGLAVMGPATPARAILVTYSTVGTFDSGDTPGTNVYTDVASGILITFDGIVSNSVEVPPTTQASLGEFNTTGTTALTNMGVASGFTLDIFQTAPDVGMLTFVGTLSGTLQILNSQAFVLFDAPLSGSIVGLFTTTYEIIEADEGVLGRANLVPPSVNNGRSSVEAEISIAAVPEPATVALAGLGIPFGLLALRRRARKVS